jgi:hypothetical protein
MTPFNQINSGWRMTERRADLTDTTVADFVSLRVATKKPVARMSADRMSFPDRGDSPSMLERGLPG